MMERLSVLAFFALYALILAAADMAAAFHNASH